MLPTFLNSVSNSAATPSYIVCKIVCEIVLEFWWGGYGEPIADICATALELTRPNLTQSNVNKSRNLESAVALLVCASKSSHN